MKDKCPDCEKELGNPNACSCGWEKESSDTKEKTGKVEITNKDNKASIEIKGDADDNQIINSSGTGTNVQNNNDKSKPVPSNEDKYIENTNNEAILKIEGEATNNQIINATGVGNNVQSKNETAVPNNMQYDSEDRAKGNESSESDGKTNNKPALIAQGKTGENAGNTANTKVDGNSKGNLMMTASGTGDNYQTKIIIKKAFNNYSRSGSKEDLRFKDPTVRLPKKPSHIPDFKLGNLDKYQQILQVERHLVISSYNKDILNIAAYEMVNKLNTSGKNEERFLCFEGENIERADLVVDSIFKIHEDKDNSMVLIVDANNYKDNHNVKKFLDSILFDSPVYREHFKNELQNNNIFLICIAYPEYFKGMTHEKKDVSHCTLWEIDYIQPIINHYFKDNYEGVERIIISQKDKMQVAERDFHNYIIERIKNGKLKEDLHGNSFSNEYSTLNNNVEALFKEMNDLKKDVLFTATYFQDLYPSDFDEIVRLFLADKVRIDTTSMAQKNDEGKEVVVNKQETKKLQDIWNKEKDTIMHECLLEIVQIEDYTKIVDFGSALLRNRCKLKQQFEKLHPMYLEDQFKQIQSSGLLFHKSMNVVRNVATLSINKAIENPDRHGKEWLINMVAGLPARLHYNIKIDQDTEPFIQALAYMEEQMQNNIYFVFSRINLLIERMLVFSQLVPMVKNFIDYLMVEKQYFAVLEIVSKHENNKYFNSFYWLKQLIERVNKDSKIFEKTDSILFNLLNKYNYAIYDFLEILQDWRPGNKKKEPNYSQTNIYSLKLFIEYSIWVTRKYYSTGKNDISSEFPFFTNLNKGNYAKSLKALTDWLLHPGIKYVFDQEQIILLISLWFTAETPENTSSLEDQYAFLEDRQLVIHIAEFYYKLLAEKVDMSCVVTSLLLAEWSNILCALEETQKIKDNDFKIFETIFSAISVNSDVPHTEIIRCLTTINVFLVCSHDLINASHYKLKKQLNKRRNLNRDLIKQYKETLKRKTRK